VLAWLRSAWNVGEGVEDEVPEEEEDCPPLTTTVDVLENLLATAVSGARLRAMAVLGDKRSKVRFQTPQRHGLSLAGGRPGLRGRVSGLTDGPLGG
jgi:hypothetical protein